VIRGGNTGVTWHALRLKLADQGTVVGEVMWTSETLKARGASPLLFNGHIHQVDAVMDAANGAVVVKDLGLHGRHHYFSGVSASAADGVLFSTGWNDPDTKKEPSAPLQQELLTAVIRMQGAQTRLLGVNSIQGLPYPRVPWLDDYANALGLTAQVKDSGLLLGKMFLSPEGVRLIPACGAIAAPAIAGNRICYRTGGALVCIAPGR